jgi:translation elongation factor aEF-1 beta
MGEVLLKYRVMPEDISTDMKALEQAIAAAMPKGVARVSKSEIRPFAFGMNALHVAIVVQDEEGNNDKVEAALATVPGQQGFELLDMGRLM